MSLGNDSRNGGHCSLQRSARQLHVVATDAWCQYRPRLECEERSAVGGVHFVESGGRGMAQQQHRLSQGAVAALSQNRPYPDAVLQVGGGSNVAASCRPV